MYGPSAEARFLTRDPLEAITRSPYAYVYNNPVNLVDPTGLGVLDSIGGFLFGGGCDGDGFLGELGGLLSDNAGYIALAGSLAAYAVPGANVVAIGFSLWSGYGNARDGNYLLAALDLVGAGGTAVVLGGDAKLLSLSASRMGLRGEHLAVWARQDAAVYAALSRSASTASLGLSALGTALGFRH